MPDLPFSINAKYINTNGVEILFSVRGTNADTFKNNILAANEMYPDAGLLTVMDEALTKAAAPTAEPQEDRLQLVKSQVAAATSNAQQRSAAASARRKDEAPKCNVHNFPMRWSKIDGIDWFCPAKNDDGTWCSNRVEVAG